MSFQQLTFEHRDNEDELAVLSKTVQLISAKDYHAALEVLAARIDKLTARPKVVPYPRVAA